MTLRLITESHGEVAAGFFSAFTQFARLEDYAFATRHLCDLAQYLAKQTAVKNTQILGYDMVIALPPWGALQITTLAEAKNTTVSRNIQTCAPNTGWGGILCDAKINLDDEYYLMRIDFANPVPYFTVNYQCKTL